MSQQINLYHPMFRRQKKVFSAVTIVQMTAVLAVAFAAIYGFGRYQVDSLETRVAELERQRDTATAQLQQVSADRRPVQRSELLQEQLRRAELELERKQRLLGELEVRSAFDIDDGSFAGFSEHFAGLGRQRVRGVWLTRIAVLEDGQVHLDGFAEQARLVPQYLQRLGRERAYSGTEFRTLRIQRTEEPRQVAFRVSTATTGDAP